MDSRLDHEGSLRFSRLEMSFFSWALAVSLLIHLGGYGGYKLGKRWGLWDKLGLPAWFHKTKLSKLEELEKQKPPEPETSLVFVDVNPNTASVEPPKDTPFYSAQNSQAANPDLDKETSQPKIDGQQTELLRTEDVPPTPYDRKRPAAPPVEAEQVAEQAKPKAPSQPGELAMAQPDSTLRPDKGTAAQNRPRRLSQLKLPESRTQLAGEKMKQEGGVARLQATAGLDVKATVTGAYDQAFLHSVEQRWYDLLETTGFDGHRSGRVVLQFRLNYDGRISEMKVVENTVDDFLSLLCQKAVLDPAPFDQWTRDMRLHVAKDYREIQLGFLYH